MIEHPIARRLSSYPIFMCANWNTKEKYDPNLLVERLEKIRVSDPAGRYAGFEGWQYEDIITVMFTSLILSPEIPETDRRNIVHIAVRSVAERGKLSVKSLIAELSKQENAYLRRPKEKLILATSLSVSYFAGLKRTSILKLPTVISARLPKTFNQQKALERPGHKLNLNVPADYAAARVYVQARSHFEAAEKALNALDLLRGIWNLYLNQVTGRRYSFGRVLPVNQVLRGPISTLHKTTGEPITDVFWYDSEYVEPVPSFDMHRKWTDIHKFEHRVRRYLRKNPNRLALEDAIRRYSGALDQRDHNMAFLSLWGLLETLTNTEKVSSDLTVERASAVWDQRDFNKHALNHLKAYRNRAVHAGHRTDEIETYLHQLRRYVEGLLCFHVYNVHGFSNFQETANFLDLPSDLTVLRKRMCLLKKAMKFHTGS